MSVKNLIPKTPNRNTQKEIKTMKKTIQSILLILAIWLIMVVSACTTAPTPASEVPIQTNTISQPGELPEATQPPPTEGILSVADVEKLAGFDVKEPAYLPNGVSFQTAVFQNSPNTLVILHYKLVHDQFGDMGAFFQITQEQLSEPPTDTISCGEQTDGCEKLEIGDQSVIYRLNPAGPEGLDWFNNGVAYRLLRTAGEPNKVYKDELVKVVESMK
jgi:hypothetical protein